MARGVDSVDTAPDEVVDPALVWWLIKMAQEDRKTYRRVRALAWEIASANPENSAIPNNRS